MVFPITYDMENEDFMVSPILRTSKSDESRNDPIHQLHQLSHRFCELHKRKCFLFCVISDLRDFISLLLIFSLYKMGVCIVSTGNGSFSYSSLASSEGILDILLELGLYHYIFVHPGTSNSVLEEILTLMKRNSKNLLSRQSRL